MSPASVFRFCAVIVSGKALAASWLDCLYLAVENEKLSKGLNLTAVFVFHPVIG